MLIAVIRGRHSLVRRRHRRVELGRPRVVYQPVVQSELGFTHDDDYFSVVNKLGAPAAKTWRTDRSELQYRRLSYPSQGCRSS